MILAGDIGGTKTNVALFETNGQTVGAVCAQQSFPSAQYESLNTILKEFLAAHKQEKLTHACFGIAGPVIDGRVETSNLAWVVEADSLAAQLGIEHVKLINDLEATASGIAFLTPDKLYTLNEGDASIGDGNRALIAAGTGLGMAGIVLRDGGGYQALASEGGHTDFAPRNEMEIDLLKYLFEKFGAHVSYERVLSGPGLFNVYCFLRDEKFAEESDGLRAEIESGNKTIAVSNAALAKRSELAVKALDMFVSIYGAMAGNLALLMTATGGLYVGGGIAPKIIEKLKDGAFMAAFKDKGRLSDFNANVPVQVILDDKTALYGAAHRALY